MTEEKLLFVLMRNDEPVGIYNSTTEAMAAQEQKRNEGWVSQDLWPPRYTYDNAKWKVFGVSDYRAEER